MLEWKDDATMTKILIIEDESELVRILRSYLEKAG